ncbi:MAG: hypothetical protein HDR21_03135 [Lachnospiraceae bacterium]|nr:hypothetical protein [Lachnospiraceae bacterium]
MNIKKANISWIFFAIYVITYLYLGVCIGNTMSKMLNLGGAALSCIVVVMVILLAFVGCAAALIVLIKENSKNEKAAARRKRRAVRNNSFFANELLPALASYLLVIISRGIYIVQFADGKLTGKHIILLYDEITSGARVEFDIFNGVERLYAYLVKGFCILLGNVPDAVYMLNLVCQVVLVFCCYLFLRVAAGKAAALSASVLFLCIPYFYRALTVCEPAQLLMALFMAGMCISAFVLKRSVFDLGGKGMLPAYLLSGLISGMLITLDLTALLIPLTVIVVFLVSVQGRRAELACFVLGILVGIPAGMVLLNVDVSGTLFSVKTSSFTLMERAMFDFSRYIESYELALSKPALLLALPEDLVLLCVIAFGGIAAVLFFWCEHDVLRIIAVPYLGMIPFACFDIGYAMGFDTGFLIACVGVLTAAITVGVIYLMGQPVAEVEARRKKADADDEETDGGQIETQEKETQEKETDAPLKKEKKKKEKAVKEEKKAKKEKPVKEEKKEKKEKPVKEEKKVKEKKADKEEQAATKEEPINKKAAPTKEVPVRQQAAVTEEKPIKEQTAVTEEKPVKEQTAAAEEKLVKVQTVVAEKVTVNKEAVATKEETASKEAVAVKEKAVMQEKAPAEKPRLIENPLPLPKKHEHREMDYAYPVSAERMHYDVDVRDGDDFDH